jgi:hypothetical protein
MATTFKDDNGREWKIRLTLGKVKTINEEIGLDLLAPWDGKAIDALTKDVMRFARAMALAVDFGADAGANTGEELADGLRGEGLDRAVLAFWRDLSNFFVGAQRLAFLTMVAKSAELWDAVWTEGTRKASAVSMSDFLLTLSTPSEAPEPPTNPATRGN